MAAERDAGSSSNTWLAFVVGALVVGLLVVGYFVYSGGAPTHNAPDFNLRIETPSLPQIPAPGPEPMPKS
ncbi:MAG TPA: hypothetical protein VG735_15425 [Caulobacterales bacterium]|nr:hypothetical protein [Caulobacterales bacterium]